MFNILIRQELTISSRILFLGFLYSCQWFLNFVYLWPHWVFVAERRGYSQVVGLGLHCTVSCGGPQALGVWAS